MNISMIVDGTKLVKDTWSMIHEIHVIESCRSALGNVVNNRRSKLFTPLSTSLYSLPSDTGVSVVHYPEPNLGLRYLRVLDRVRSRTLPFFVVEEMRLSRFARFTSSLRTITDREGWKEQKWFESYYFTERTFVLFSS